MKKVPKKSNKSNRTRTIIAIVTGIVIVVLALVLIPRIVESNDIGIANANAARAVKAARDQQQPRFDSERMARVQALYSAGIVAEQANNLSSKVDVCYINHDDAGWVINNYYQQCYMRYVDLLETTLASEDIVQKLTNAQDTSLFGSTISADGACGPLVNNDYAVPTLSYLKLSDSTGPSDYACTIPDQLQGYTTIDPIILDSGLHPKVYRSFENTQVDPTKAYVVIATDSVYYREELGCPKHALLEFGCDSPRNEPITGY